MRPNVNWNIGVAPERKSTYTSKILKAGIPFSSQVTEPDTKYIIKYDFDLDSDVTLPDNCILEFDGGSINGNYTINGNFTKITVDDYTQIFKDTILSGSFDCDHLSVCNFGVEVGEDNALNNSTILNKCIIPSMGNILIPLVFPKVKEGEYYYINTPITIKGDFDVICKGLLFWNGADDSVAITIGDPLNVKINHKYVIRIERSSINYVYDPSADDYVIPESYGVKFVNLQSCEIELPVVSNFAYNVFVSASNGKGSVYNQFKLGRIGGYSYTNLLIKHEDLAWINDNIFYGGKLYTFSTNVLNDKNIGVEMVGTSTHFQNNNVFIKPCLEGNHFGFKSKYALYNNAYSPRMEAVSAPTDNGVLTVLPFKTSYTGEANEEITYNELKDIKYKTIFESNCPLMTNSNVKTRLPLYVTEYSTASLGNPSLSTTASAYTAGIIVDVSTIKRIRVEGDVAGRYCFIILNDNYESIRLDDTNKDTYIAGDSPLKYVSFGFVYASSNVFYTEIKVTNNVKKLFVGFIAATTACNYIRIATPEDIRLPQAKLLVLNPIDLILTTVPSTTENVKIGQVFGYNDDAIMWTGTKWTILGETQT